MRDECKHEWRIYGRNIGVACIKCKINIINAYADLRAQLQTTQQQLAEAQGEIERLKQESQDTTDLMTHMADNHIRIVADRCEDIRREKTRAEAAESREAEYKAKWQESCLTNGRMVDDYNALKQERDELRAKVEAMAGALEVLLHHWETPSGCCDDKKCFPGELHDMMLAALTTTACEAPKPEACAKCGSSDIERQGESATRPPVIDGWRRCRACGHKWGGRWG